MNKDLQNIVESYILQLKYFEDCDVKIRERRQRKLIFMSLNSARALGTFISHNFNILLRCLKTNYTTMQDMDALINSHKQFIDQLNRCPVGVYWSFLQLQKKWEQLCHTMRCTISVCPAFSGTIIGDMYKLSKMIASQENLKNGLTLWVSITFRLKALQQNEDIVLKKKDFENMGYLVRSMLQ